MHAALTTTYRTAFDTATGAGLDTAAALDSAGESVSALAGEIGITHFTLDQERLTVTEIVPWQAVELWSEGGVRTVSWNSALPMWRSEVLRALAEYRRTGGILGYWLGDPADWDDKTDELAEAGPRVCDIDWSGFEDVCAEVL